MNGTSEAEDCGCPTGDTASADSGSIDDTMMQLLQQVLFWLTQMLQQNGNSAWGSADKA